MIGRNKDPQTTHADAEEQADEPTVDEPCEAADEEARQLLEDARAKADEHFDKLLRVQAEMENLRKRSARELESARKFALEKFVAELLPVRDSMEMGVAAAVEHGGDVDKLREGMELTLKMLSDAMSKFGIEDLDPQGERFDPDLHQAMSMQENPDVAANTVVNVIQKGYRLQGRLVRPALVVVSSGGPSQSGQSGAGADKYRSAEQSDEAAGQGHVDEQA